MGGARKSVGRLIIDDDLREGGYETRRPPAPSSCGDGCRGTKFVSSERGEKGGSIGGGGFLFLFGERLSRERDKQSARVRAKNGVLSGSLVRPLLPPVAAAVAPPQLRHGAQRGRLD